jgi:hypothetical protein
VLGRWRGVELRRVGDCRGARQAPAAQRRSSPDPQRAQAARLGHVQQLTGLPVRLLPAVVVLLGRAPVTSRYPPTVLIKLHFSHLAACDGQREGEHRGGYREL